LFASKATTTRRPGGHQDGVAHRTGEALAVDLDDLELVTVQVHRMGHPGAVDHDQLHPLARGDR